jgi:transcriptional regulator of acetoin/glycerol metabolism
MGRFLSHVDQDTSSPQIGPEPWLGVPAMRPVIAASWQRSSACRVGNEKEPELPYLPDFDSECRLTRAARPVLERLMTTLSGTTTSIILADSEGRLLERWVGEHCLNKALDEASAAPGFVFAEEFAGTNGVGTVLEDSSAVTVRGGEHYADFLKDLACVGVPILHPLLRTVEGVLDITCLARAHDPLMAPLLVEAVRHIETQLAQQSSPQEIALLEEFLSTCRRYPGAVVGLNPALNLTNAAATEHLVPFDHPVLWEFGRQLTATGRTEGVVELAHGSCKVHCLPVTSGSRGPSGMVMRLDFASPRASRIRAAAKTGTPLLGQPLPGRSPQWRQVMSRISNLARVCQPVAITGEAGVGKLHLARYLHELSGPVNPDSSLRVFDASTMADTASVQIRNGIAEALTRGDTVVLRRINCLLPPAIAVLRSLVTQYSESTRSPKGRLIVTVVTPPDTAEADEPATTYFLHQVRVPPLRQRTEDIADLVPTLLAEHMEHKDARCSMPALQTLLRCRWPGNVTELKEAVSIALTTSAGCEIQPRHLPTWVLKRSGQSQLSTLERAERNAIIEALVSVDNNRTEAAKVLGIGRATLYRKIRGLGIPTGQELIC